MKTIFKPILYCIFIFIITTIGITDWYISNHLLSNLSEISTQSIIDISLQIGLVGALIPTISFFLVYIAFNWINSKLLRGFLIISVIILTIITIYMFILYMTFYEFNTPIQFVINNL